MRRVFVGGGGSAEHRFGGAKRRGYVAELQGRDLAGSVRGAERRPELGDRLPPRVHAHKALHVCEHDDTRWFASSLAALLSAIPRGVVVSENDDVL